LFETSYHWDSGGLMTDPYTVVTAAGMVLAKTAAGTVLGKLFTRLRERGPRDVQAEQDRVYEEWVRDLDAHVRLLVEDCIATKRRVQDLENVSTRDASGLARVVEQLGVEASRDLRLERRDMLMKAAGACLVESTLSMVELNRLLRALRELEPEDVVELNKISPEGYILGEPPQAIPQLLVPLVVAGCLLFQTTSRPFPTSSDDAVDRLVLTPTGCIVQRLLASWKPVP
jgi:hypothetical protein